MVIYSNTAEQVLAVGQSLTLTKISGCTCNNQVNPTPGAKVKGNGVFGVSFSGNIASATAAVPIQLSIAINGTVIPTTQMSDTPSVADTFRNVSTTTGFSGNCCCLGTNITVVNTGTNPVTVAANSSLVVWQDN